MRLNNHIKIEKLLVLQNGTVKKKTGFCVDNPRVERYLFDQGFYVN